MNIPGKSYVIKNHKLDNILNWKLDKPQNFGVAAKAVFRKKHIA